MVAVTRFAIDPRTFLLVARAGRAIDSGHQLVAPSSLRTRALELMLAEVRAVRSRSGRHSGSTSC